MCIRDSSKVVKARATDLQRLRDSPTDWLTASSSSGPRSTSTFLPNTASSPRRCGLRLNQTRRVASRLAALICLHYPAARKSIRFLLRRTINLLALSSCIQPGSVGLQLITARGYSLRLAGAGKREWERKIAGPERTSPVGPEDAVFFFMAGLHAKKASSFQLPASS